MAANSLGHSLIIDPWGEILAEGGDEAEVVSADLELTRLEEVRCAIDVYGDRRADLYGVRTT